MPAPLVSIMLPCFNAAESLPFALASVLAQTHGEWECICLDDGSTDGTWELLHQAAHLDPRFVIERFERNQGRGAARQRILEKAGGEFLTFLDSDDWMYPERIATELRWFAADPHIVAVSACAAVTIGTERLVGVQRPAAPHPLPLVAMFEKPVPPPLVFPASMVRTEPARRAGFDPEFRRSQDSDFLIRLLVGKHYALAPDVVYAYSQGSAASLERTLDGYRYRARSHRRHWRSFPLRVSRTLAETGGKYAMYRIAGLLGVEQRLIERRWSSPDEDTKRAFHAALEVVRTASRPFSRA